MEWLKTNPNSSNDAVQINNMNLDTTEKRIIKLQNDFKDLFYNNREIKNLSVKIKMEEGAQKLQQKRRPIPILLQEQVAKELKLLIDHGYLEKATAVTGV